VSADPLDSVSQSDLAEIIESWPSEDVVRFWPAQRAEIGETIIQRLAFVLAEVAGSVASWAFAHSGDRPIPRRRR